MRLIMPMTFVVALGTLAVALGTLWLGFTFHQFEEFEDASLLTCETASGITGASDIEPVPARNAAFMSVYDPRGDAERGSIVRFDFSNPLSDDSWRDRTGGRPVLFEPAGIDLFEERLPSGILMQRLFVVNRAGPDVLLFDVAENGDLTLADRFALPELTSPNDVVATGASSFYVTNDTASGRQSVRGKADFLLGLPTGSIFHYDGDGWEVVADGLRFPNGLALSGDEATLYVAEMRAQAVRSYGRDPATGALEAGRITSLETFPNNLSVDSGGRVLVGSVPQPFVFEAFTEGLRDTAPSRIVAIENGDTEVLLQNSGRLISAATVAAEVNGRTIIGTAGDDRFLMCRPAPQRSRSAAEVVAPAEEEVDELAETPEDGENAGDDPES